MGSKGELFSIGPKGEFFLSGLKGGVFFIGMDSPQKGSLYTPASQAPLHNDERNRAGAGFRKHLQTQKIGEGTAKK